MSLFSRNKSESKASKIYASKIKNDWDAGFKQDIHYGKKEKQNGRLAITKKQLPFMIELKNRDI